MKEAKERKIDYSWIASMRTRSAIHERIEKELAEYGGEPPYLSDIYINVQDGGCWYLEALAMQHAKTLNEGKPPFKWKLLVLKDEWGNVPQPGEKVHRILPKNRKNLDGNMVSGKDLTKAMRDGSYHDKYETKREYIVDEKGCITVGFEDAGYFITNWGRHGKTGYAITRHPELSGEPVRYGQGSRHVHYWRYAEQTTQMWKELPKRVKE